MREKLLFVTKGGEDCDNGFSYVSELAKTLDGGVAILVLYHQKAAETYEDIMAAVAFAEAGDHATVRELLERQAQEIRKKTEKKIEEMARICEENSLLFSYDLVAGDLIPAIKECLKKKPTIEMVLLSPNLSGNKKVLDLKKLLKNITRPVVSMSRPAKASA